MMLTEHLSGIFSLLCTLEVVTAIFPALIQLQVTTDCDSLGGFIEITTRVQKTARSASQKAQFLPIVAPSLGVTGEDWVVPVSETFHAVGLQLEGRINGPLMRPPGLKSVGPCKRGIMSSEVTKFLRLLFESGSVSVDEPRVSSHSLKATALSWCAKAGLSGYDKAVLGRHTSIYTEAQAAYSRDLAVGAVTKLQEIILRIPRKEFSPDNARRGYFPEAPAVEPTRAVQDLVKIEDEEIEPEGEHAGQPSGDLQVSDLEGSSADSNAESESDSDEEVVPPAPTCYRHQALGPLAGKFVSHVTSKTVHYIDSLSAQGSFDRAKVLSCGRVLNANYKEVTSFETVAVCRRCRTNAVKDGLLPQV